MCIKLFRRKNVPEDVKKTEVIVEEVKQVAEEKAEDIEKIPAPPKVGKAKRSLNRTQSEVQGIGQVPLPGSGTVIKK